jgi:hypothetical protein
VDNQRLQIGVGAFMLRQRDAGRLSVYREALESPEQVFPRLPRSQVLVAVTAAAVRALRLQVAAAGTVDNPAHALILGLPEPNPDDPGSPEHQRAAEMAGELMSLARVVAYRPGSLDALAQLLITQRRFAP